MCSFCAQVYRLLRGDLHLSARRLVVDHISKIGRKKFYVIYDTVSKQKSDYIKSCCAADAKVRYLDKGYLLYKGRNK